MDDTYPMPEHGWTCFHCGETFTTPGSAQDHFGAEPTAEPACRIKAGSERGLVMAIRRAEENAAEAWSRVASETVDAVLAMHQMAARHVQQIKEVEEDAYERGLEDGKEVARNG